MQIPVGAEPFGLHLSDRSAVAAVVEGLADPDPRVRRVSAYVLGEMDPDAGDRATPHLPCVTTTPTSARPRSPRSFAASGRSSLAGDRRAIERCPMPACGSRSSTRSGALAAEDATISPRATARRLRSDRCARTPLPRSSNAARVPKRSTTLSELAAHADEDRARCDVSCDAGLDGPGLFDLASVGMSDAAPVRASRSRAGGSPRSIRRGRLAPLTGALADEHPSCEMPSQTALGVVGVAAADSVVDVAQLTDRDGKGRSQPCSTCRSTAARDDVRRFAVEMVAGAVDSHRLAMSIEGDADDRALAAEGLAALEVGAGSDARPSSSSRARRAAIAMSVAIENLSVADPTQRANAIEVIESVGRTGLVRPLLAIWEGTATDRSLTTLSSNDSRAIPTIGSEPASSS